MSTIVQRPSVEQVWAWLDDVPDPEVPVVSVVDLGIVRTVEWSDDTLVVTTTPTYSGCPATAVIDLEIEAALRAHGVEQVALKRRLSPAWTTAWITDKGREKLHAYGIAPPVEGTSCAGALRLGGTAALVVACPRCGSDETEVISRFGSTPCKANYRCTACLEPFDYFKAH